MQFYWIYSELTFKIANKKWSVQVDGEHRISGRSIFDLLHFEILKIPL